MRSTVSCSANCKYRQSPYQMHQGELQLKYAASRVRQSVPWPNSAGTLSRSCARHPTSQRPRKPSILQHTALLSLTCGCNDRVRVSVGLVLAALTITLSPLQQALFPSCSPPDHHHPSHYPHPSTLCRFVINSLSDSQPRPRQGMCTAPNYIA
jgi:hypothetical protein